MQGICGQIQAFCCLQSLQCLHEGSRTVIMRILEIQVQKINRILQQMQSSRRKTPCAYAKVCKSKTKGVAPHSKTELPASPRSKRSDHIYEQLLNELASDESEYIKSLCKKNELKIKKMQEAREKTTKIQSFQDITNLASEPSQKSINNAFKEPSARNRSQIASNSSIKATKKDIVAQDRREPSKKMQMSLQSSFSQLDQPSNRYFLSNLDHYIAKLNQNGPKQSESYCEKASLNKYQSQGERQFRRTVELSSSKQRQQNNDVVSRTKYSKLLDKLHEELVEKQALQYKLDCKDMKMNHMKQIIQQMYGEIATLRRELVMEKEEREKYSSMAEQFASKVHNVRSSKEKHYMPHHQKRNSHIPSSTSNANDFSDFFNKTGWQQGRGTSQLRHDFERTRDREEVSTLKKKGMHKYKISQIFMEGSESEQEKASIYHDSYL